VFTSVVVVLWLTLGAKLKPKADNVRLPESDDMKAPVTVAL
jgi:hypothetical protein